MSFFLGSLLRNIFLFLYLLSTLTFLEGGEVEYTEPQDVATTEGLPSSIINGAVCAITGEYTDSMVDVVLPGPEPLTFGRVYTSFSSFNPWTFNHHDKIEIRNAQYETIPSYLISLYQASGAKLDYFFKKTGHDKKIDKAKFKLIVPTGMTNGATLLSGKANIKNQKITYFPKERKAVFRSGDGSVRLFKKLKKENERGSIELGQIHEDKINGSRIRYKSKGEGISCPNQIICENKDTKTPYSSLAISHENVDKYHFLNVVKTSDNRTLKYLYERHRYHEKDGGRDNNDPWVVKRTYLTKVEHDYAPKIKYSYSEKSLSRDKHITKKSNVDGSRFLSINYYHPGTNHVQGSVGNINLKDDDYRMNRVKSLEAPVGKDDKAITTHRFDYHANIKEERGVKRIKDGYTDVYDAEDHKTRYRYDDEHRLISITRYRGTRDRAYSQYSKECFIWDKEGSLIAKIFKDGEDQIHHGRLFTYDQFGNVSSSTLCGNLTGKNNRPIKINSKGELISKEFEQQTTTYEYSNDGLNLLLGEIDSNGIRTRYDYIEKSNILKAKRIIQEGICKQREFYFYDKNNALVTKVSDDGAREWMEDVTGVTERKITRIKPRKDAPVGLPEEIEEIAVRFPEQEEILLKRIENKYSDYGQLIKQKVFDGENNHAFNLEWKYDAHGNVIEETDALGMTVAREYDLKTDNLLVERYPDYEIHNTYDFSNRLTEKREIHGQEVLTTSQSYDYLGNCKAVVDHFGNRTTSEFDDFGRVIKKSYPPVSYQGEMIRATEEWEYDIAGYPISKTDSLGRATCYEVNIRGQPTKIFYPDGTSEEMIYSLQGWLMEKRAKNGVKTIYERDSFGRITLESLVGGDQRQDSSYTYSTLHLIESIDPEGNKSSYTYDPAGRLSQTVKNRSAVEYFYDSLGRVGEEREYFGDSPNEYQATIKEYDRLDRLVDEKIKDAEGRTLYHSRYEYDLRGNQTVVQMGDQRITSLYNTLNEVIEVSDALGNTTHLSYNRDFTNDYGQRVLQKTATDPLGYRTVETYDTADRLIEVVRLNPEGRKVARQLIEYDLVGNQISTRDEVIEDGNVVREVKNLFAYNEGDQLIESVEGAGTQEEKVTNIRYNWMTGQKEALILPGVEIYYDYDPLDRLKRCHSSDNTIDYLYSYNALDQIKEVRDQNTGKSTKRIYHQGDLVKEELANGLTLDYTYDRMGRTRTVTLPDRTGIEYVYDAANLKEVHRLADGRRIYSHCDVSHSLAGQVLKAQPPGNLSAITFDYDRIARCRSIKGSSFSQVIPSDGYDRAGNLLKYNIWDVPYTFSYDDLYQLKQEKGHSLHSYRFDSIGNRRFKDGTGSFYNALNQQTTNGKEVLTHDLNGNLKENGSSTYEYDAFGRMIKSTSYGVVTTYAYDGFDRRMSKTISGQEELFLYQGLDEIGRWKSGKCQEMRLLGSNPLSRTVAMELNGVRCVPIHDIRGNIVALLDFQGNTLEEYFYTAYGEREIISLKDGVQIYSALGNPWQYAGKRFDEETGLVAFGMRYYDPVLARWTTPDPAGFLDGINLYVYVHNNPMLYIDRYGLFGESFFAGLQDFEWKSSFRDSSFYQSFESTAQNIWNSPRFQGSMQAMGGFAEAGFGAGMTFATAGVATPVGCAVMAHGLDHFFTGMNSVITGRPTESVTSQLFQTAGMSPENAHLLDIGLSLAGSLGGMKLAQQGASAFKSSAANIGGKFIGLESINTGKQSLELNRFHQAAKNLTPEGKNNIRILRGWAKSKGWHRLPNANGAPETWGVHNENKFYWLLKIKPEASFRQGLEAGSNIPRFDARLRFKDPVYINPFTGEFGRTEVGRHIPLNKNY